MGREAFIKINCKRYSKDINDIIKLLYESGWNCYNNKGLVEYLPIGDIDEYNWTSNKISLEELNTIISTKQQNNETIGLNLFFNDSYYGISLLADSASNIIFGLDINRKISEEDITDIGWYFENIIVPLAKSGCIIDVIEFHENGY